jgi:hypothetical protein
MPRHVRVEEAETGQIVVRLTTHRRTLSETELEA